MDCGGRGGQSFPVNFFLEVFCFRPWLSLLWFFRWLLSLALAIGHRRLKAMSVLYALEARWSPDSGEILALKRFGLIVFAEFPEVHLKSI
jgi:hypothetical protein